MQLSIQTIKEAHNRIKPYIINTPIKSNNEINNLVDADIYFKCENLQNSGSFKFRGASNAIFSLNDDEANNGVITVSSGNHGTALSLAAKNRGIEKETVNDRSQNFDVATLDDPLHLDGRIYSLQILRSLGRKTCLVVRHHKSQVLLGNGRVQENENRRRRSQKERSRRYLRLD